MVACLSSAPVKNARFLNSHTHNHSNNKPKFGSQEALNLLQKCSNFTHVKLVQAKIIRNNLSDDQLLVRKLLRLCFSYQKVDYATLIFDQIQNPHTFTWNFMIRAYNYNACLDHSALDKGKEVHGFAIKTGFWKDTFLSNTLMDLYFKCGDLDYARKLFDKMAVRSVVSWTTFVAGLVACGELDTARAAFDEMPMRNVVSWTAMINGYVKNQRPQEAFELFQRMQLANVRPNGFTLVGLLRACTELGSLELGRRIHEYALENGFKVGVFLGTALIDMYSKCGSIEDAKKVFEEMQKKSLATWNSMITSLGVHGFGKEALALFAQMEEANVRPDAITFVGVLFACVNTNNVEAGYRYFKYMTEHYGITPMLEHYTCMIELYTRAAMLNEVSELVNSMPMKLNSNPAAALVWPSIIDSNAENENFFEHHEDLHCIGTPFSSQNQFWCFKWDVG
ncbi:pentatricopeptide repeat-containing protein At3g26630, chloroplastic isoform X2 [Ricinus communis]|uniref:pentatricopeptide repeat-containing protein At3g26630, chloroplastic isoform X2 n=1 Tax=Ricinus communis TaxID=3988 RepID=UPI00201B175C|nr:pentatricopeptide repeat-containing protein At3g26630, chloroplastic isoform X2 [Ricinus communis]